MAGVGNVCRLSLLTVVMGLALLCLSPVSLAEEGARKPEADTPKPKAGIKVTVVGRVFCLGCELKEKHGANSYCSLGHATALEVHKAVGEDGKELPEMRGWVLHYLLTTKTWTLQRKGQFKDHGHIGKGLIIKGKVYPAERVLEVESMESSSKNLEPLKGITDKLGGMVEATVEGTNLCVACTLKKKGAKGDCLSVGHFHALWVTKATDKEGKEIPATKGWVLHYLKNTDKQHHHKGPALMRTQRGKKLVIKGKVYSRYRVLEVESTNVDAELQSKGGKFYGH